MGWRGCGAGAGGPRKGVSAYAGALNLESHNAGTHFHCCLGRFTVILSELSQLHKRCQSGGEIPASFLNPT